MTQHITPKTRLMGVLNVTPDSSFDKGRHFSLDKTIERAFQIQSEGADILDIGGESTRPNALPVSEEDELARVIPAIKAISQSTTIPISIDTMKWRVAAAALEAGASFINDVTGLQDHNMRKLAADTGVEVCVMHMQGEPRSMQDNPQYPNGIIPHLKEWFAIQIDSLLQAGINKSKIYLDPGFGFGKTVAHNLEIVHNLAELKKLGFPILVGLSRKSFMGKINNKTYDELLPETLAIHTVAILQSVDILRVHDVKENAAIVNLLHNYLNYK